MTQPPEIGEPDDDASPPPRPPESISRPPGQSRFDSSSVVVGGGVGCASIILWLPISIAFLGWLNSQTGYTGNKSVAVILTLLLPFVPGLVLAVRGRSREARGWGIGLLIGWGLAVIIGGGLCVALIRSYGG